MNQYLSLATNKFKSDRSVNYDLPLEDFICQCYVKLTPNNYGTRVQERLRRELNVNRVSQRLGMGDFEICRKYFEVKVSYLSSKEDSYYLLHLRPWQRFNYYLLCFVDCENDFKPNFYVIDKHVIHKFKLNNMHGTADANSDNHNVELRISIENNSDSMRILKRSNLLKDTSLQSLKSFIRSL
jgi:hypothetical protein